MCVNHDLSEDYIIATAAYLTIKFQRKVRIWGDQVACDIIETNIT